MVRRRGGTPGGFDPDGDGGSDDVGADDSDPRDAPSARGGGGGGFDADDPRDAPSARGGGGGSDDDPDPSPGPSTGGGSPSFPGGVDPGPADAEPASTTLDSLGRSFTENVAEPVGQFTEATNPAAQVEQATLGTNRIGRVSEGFGEGVAQIANVPGNTAAAIDAAQTLDEARGRAVDPVTIGGVPTGVTVPDLEGQRENTERAAGAGAAAAGAAASSPFETAGRLAGGAVGGAAASRGIARLTRSTPDSAGPSDSVPSGRSQVGTEGRGSLLEDVDVDAQRGVSGPSTAARVRGEVSRTIADVRDRVDEFADAGDTDRGQLQIGGQGRGTGETDFGDAPDRTRPADAGGTFEDVRDDALTQIQDDLRDRGGRPTPGDFERAPQPFRDRGGDTIDDAGVQLQRTTATPDSGLGGVETAGTTGSGATGLGAGLGSVAAVNDPTGITPSGATTGSRSRAGARGGTGAGSFGTLAGVLDGANDVSGIAPTGDTDTGTGIGAETGTDTISDTATDTLTDTGGRTDTRTRTEPIEELRGRTTVGTQQRAGASSGAAVSSALAEPDVATDFGADGFRAVRGGGFGGGTTTARGPRGEESDEDDDEAPLFGLQARADEFDSGLASGAEQLEQFGFRL